MPSDPSFIAILNYLIDVFLRQGLSAPLEAFLLPPLQLRCGYDSGMGSAFVKSMANTIVMD